MGYFGRNEEGNGKNERPDKVIAITLPDLKHLFYCDNYWFSDSLFSDSAISFWIVSTDSFNISSCSDVVKNIKVNTERGEKRMKKNKKEKKPSKITVSDVALIFSIFTLIFVIINSLVR